MKKVLIDNVEYIPASSKKELIEKLKKLVNFKTGDGHGYPITSKDLRQNEKDYGRIEDGLPFFCESTLYTLMGKEDARTLLGALHFLTKVCGVELDDLYITDEKYIKELQKEFDELTKKIKKTEIDDSEYRYMLDRRNDIKREIERLKRNL
jgi:hypothetical protein